MTVLSNIDICNYRDHGEIKIDPFDKKSLQGASYDLKIGRILAHKYGLIEHESESKSLILKPGEYVEIESLEDISVSDNICAIIGFRSSWSRKGIAGYGGLQIDPGYHGNIYVTIFNPSSHNFEIKLDDVFVTLMFFTLKTTSTMPYTGPYQGSHQFPEKEAFHMGQSPACVFAETISDVVEINAKIKELNDKLLDLKNQCNVHEKVIWYIVASCITGIISGIIIGVTFAFLKIHSIL